MTKTLSSPSPIGAADDLLGALASAGEDHARRILIDVGQPLIPMFLVVLPDRSIAIVPTPWRDNAEKAMIFGSMGPWMRDQGALAYSLLLESWFVMRRDGWKDGMPTPSQSPDRQEAIVLHAEDAEGRKLDRMWRIVRSSSGAVTDLEPLVSGGTVLSRAPSLKPETKQ
jgi:hypothetical protein